jgi:hypothetical protein
VVIEVQKFFNRTTKEQPQPSEEEKQIQKYDIKIQKLKAEKKPINDQVRTLHSRKLHEPQPFEKKRIEAELQKPSIENNRLEAEINRLREAQALPKCRFLWKNNHNRVFLTINGLMVEIPANLEIEIKFSCGHSFKMPIYELLRHQSTLTTNHQLYSRWNAIFANSENAVGTFLCEECMKQKKKELADRHIYTPTKRTGQANWSLEVR